MLQTSSYFSSLIAVDVEWETSELVVAENSVPTFLCASVVNPDIFNLRASVQLQAFTQPLTAQGIATVNRSWKHLLYTLSLYTENEDYIPVTSTLIFALATNSTQCVALSIIDDLVLENDEEFFLQTMNNSLVTSISPSVAITIEDNDSKLINEYCTTDYYYNVNAFQVLSSDLLSLSITRLNLAQYLWELNWLAICHFL